MDALSTTRSSHKTADARAVARVTRAILSPLWRRNKVDVIEIAHQPRGVTGATAGVTREKCPKSCASGMPENRPAYPRGPARAAAGFPPHCHHVAYNAVACEDRRARAPAMPRYSIRAEQRMLAAVPRWPCAATELPGCAADTVAGAKAVHVIFLVCFGRRHARSGRRPCLARNRLVTFDCESASLSRPRNRPSKNAVSAACTRMLLPASFFRASDWRADERTQTYTQNTPSGLANTLHAYIGTQ
jgi:hypothetical protein